MSLLVVTALCLCPSGTSAQELYVDDVLHFGSFALKDNNSPHIMIVGADNSVTYDNAFVTVEDANRGAYTLENLTPDTALGITIDDASLTENESGMGPAFTISDYTHNSPVTDGSGNATLYIGAKLTTSGNGSYYTTSTYKDHFDLTIVF